MSNTTAGLLDRILTILEQGLPRWAVATLVAIVCVLAALAALAYARRASTNITVRFNSNAVTPNPASQAHAPLRINVRRCYAELNRIAHLDGDDAELWIS